MADKFNNETLRQQRKAREEYLKLKKMQSGEMPVPSPTGEDSVSLDTFSDKLKNFWYYHRWSAILTFSIVLVFAFLIAQCVSRPDYDLIITVYTSSPVSNSDSKLITEYFEKLCDDVNGDNVAKVLLADCSYSEDGDPQLSLVATRKMQASIVSEPKAILFITDEHTFQILNNISESTVFFDGEPIPLDSDFYNYCEANDLYDLPKGLMISNRVLKNTNFEKNETAKKCYDAAKRILSKLRSE